MGDFIAARFYDGTAWLQSLNHLRNETRGGVVHLKGILFDERHIFMSSEYLV